MSFGIPVRNGLGLGLLASTSLATGNVGSAPFTPASLFASGAPGFLLDATLADLSSLFQDSAGTTPVTAVEQPVGLVLDTSQGLALGPELVTNGTFDANINGWAAGTTSGGTIAWQSPGSMRITRTSATTTGQRTISVLAGVTYIITAQSTFVSGTGNPFLVIKDTDAAATGTILTNSSGPVAQSFSHVAYFTAPSTGTLYIHAGVGTANSVYDFDNITTKSIAGNHFVQSTSAARPVLSARVNLLTKTEQFNDAYWGTASRVTISANTTDTTDPLGGNTADKMVEVAATGTHRLQANVTGYAVVGGATQTLRSSVWFKKGTRDWAWLSISDAGGTNQCQAWYDLTNGVVGTVTNLGNASGASATITADVSGWYICTLSGKCSTTAGDATTLYGMSTGDNVLSYAGDITKNLYIWGADLRVANDTASPVYQRVNTATDYATTGFPLYLRYDGTDDFLVSAATVNFSTTAQMSVFAGVRKLVNAVDLGLIVELSASSATTNGTFGLFGNVQFGINYTYAYDSRGTVNAGANTKNTAYSSPHSGLLTGLSNIAGDLTTLRINGIQIAQNTSDQGTGNYGDYLTYIGMRAGTSFPFNGRIYFPMVVLGRTATATEITNMESYLSASMGGGYVPTGYDFLVDANGDQLTDASGNALYTIPLYS